MPGLQRLHASERRGLYFAKVPRAELHERAETVVLTNPTAPITKEAAAPELEAEGAGRTVRPRKGHDVDDVACGGKLRGIERLLSEPAFKDGVLFVRHGLSPC
jgi:hypothetical protein